MRDYSGYIDLARNLCQKAGGEVIDSDVKIVTKNQKFSVKCKDGHVWLTNLENLQYKKWCLKCSRIFSISKSIESRKRKASLRIYEIRSFVESKNGKCLSDVFVNSKTKLEFECEKGHKWFALWSNVKRNRWCQKCFLLKSNEIFIKKSKYQIDVCQKLAEKRFGKCLSTTPSKYIEWECYFGHVFKMTPHDVKKRNRWCSICSTSSSEKLCRLVFETIFGEKFPRCRPEWLKNKNGFRLELDGFCEKLNLAFEHNGKQHYTEKCLFARRDGFDLLHIQDNDFQKNELCKNNGVKLITIPVLHKITKFKDLKNLIKDFCIKENISISEELFSIDINLNDIFKLNYLDSIDTKTLKCVSKSYINYNQKLKWECLSGHSWEEALPSIHARKFTCKQCKRT